MPKTTRAAKASLEKLFSRLEKLFSKYQSGFQKGLNVKDCLKAMIEKFRKSSNAYGEDVAFLTDLHKAFGYIPL